MMTIRAIAICPDNLMLADLRQAALQTGGSLELIRRLPYYPCVDELERLIRTYGPDLLFLEASDGSRLRELATIAERVTPGIALVAVSRERSADLLLPCVQAGVQDFLLLPFSQGQIDGMLQRVARRIRERPPELWHSPSVFGFTSAKPGSGATTLAAHLSLAMPRQTPCRPVLFDLDSHSSFLDFMLKLKKRASILEAAGFASEIDESLWDRLVANVGGVDYLGMGETMSASHLSSECVGNFIDYARRQYDLVSLDIPSRLDDETLPLLYRCSTIFLVCTPEVGSLHMARRRLTQLENEGMTDRVRVVVNRVTSHSERTAALPELLRHDVFATVANSYEPLQQAIESGRPVDARTPFGESIERLAARCLGQKPKKQSWRLPDLLRALLPGTRTRDTEPASGPQRLLLPPNPTTAPLEEAGALMRRGYLQ